MPSAVPFRFALAAVAVTCLAAAAGAQTPGMMPGAAPGMMPGQVPGQPQTVLLDAQIVEQFITSYPAIQSGLDELEQQYDLPETGGSQVNAWQGLAAYQQVTGELNGIVSPYGFGSYGEWVVTASSIAMAYAFAQQGGAMDSQMAATIAQVQNDPNIPDGQKQMIIQQMQAQSQIMAGMQPPQQNIDAVSGYATELDALFDSN